MSSDKAKWLPNQNPLVPPHWDRAIAYAVRAWRTGTATADQQKLAFEWVMYITTALPEYQDVSFRPGPDGDRLTAFAEGKRFPGLQILKMFSEAVSNGIDREAEREAEADKRRQKPERRGTI